MSGTVIPGGRRVPAELVIDTNANTSGSNTFLATFEGFSDPIVGLAVCGSVADPTVGITSVTPASGTSTQGAATVRGVIVSVGQDASVRVQFAGIITLTEAEWAVVVSGGLNAAEAYFVDAAGHMTNVAPGTPGNWSSQVLVGLNATQALLCTPSVPVEVQ